ncbi:MAG TPA: hypothetical protein VFF72_10595, partial [Caldimonas sp.]|nr:hypothetical protein [Caldimonas sp.]
MAGGTVAGSAENPQNLAFRASTLASAMNDDPQERARQQAVDALGLDSLTDTAYDDITRAAAELFGTPIALITILDGDRQWFKSR